jgi:ubiquinone/menaquinone biosynthesis C-methylase UbiE
VRVQLEAEVGTEKLVAQVAGFARFLQRGLEDLVAVEDLAVDVVVADLRAQHVAGDRHALDQLVRVVAQDVAVLEGARLALVAVADDVLVARRTRAA